MQKYTLYIIIGVIVLFSSCKRDSYETGEGDLSYLRADYTDITILNGTITNAITDGDVTLHIPSTVKYADENVKDTLIRRLLYYNMTDASEEITLRKSIAVAVVLPHTSSLMKKMPTDPVKLTSAWVSQNKKYLNMQLGLMVGHNDDDAAKQQLAIVCDSVRTAGKNTVYLTLYHDQANYEQYYTQDVYMSVPMNVLDSIAKSSVYASGSNATPTSVGADTITLTVNTYSGKQVRQFVK